MDRVKYNVVWVAISILAGTLGRYFFELEFLSAALIAGLALIAKGLIATWEDRGTFND
jgi:hypothetical protein